MKIKNISEGAINLKSGLIKTGESGEATFDECKVLFSSGKVEEYKAPVKPAVTKSKSKEVRDD